MKNKIKKFLEKGNICNQDNRKNAGITLVALVITIIVLLILAGISIAQLSGNGLFEKAKLAKEVSKNVQEDEDKKIAEYNNEIDTYIDGERADISLKGTILYKNESGNNKIGTFDLNENVDNYNYFEIFYKVDFNSIYNSVKVNKKGVRASLWHMSPDAGASSGIYFGTALLSIPDTGKTCELQAGRLVQETAHQSWINRTDVRITEIIGYK